MSIWTGDWAGRSRLDYALIAISGMVVVAFLGLGIYGVSTGFLQSIGYFKANDAVSFCCALIAAGCAFALMLELAPQESGRMRFGVVMVCAMFGYFAVSKGVPAAVTLAYGKPGSVIFDITSHDWGSKGCSYTVVAQHRGYEDFRMCSRHFNGLEPKVGRHIEVTGVISNWGITREDIRVLR